MFKVKLSLYLDQEREKEKRKRCKNTKKRNGERKSNQCEKMQRHEEMCSCLNKLLRFTKVPKIQENTFIFFSTR